MIATTFQGENVYLLPYRANWQKGFSAFFSRVNDVEGSREGPEARMALNNSIRTRMQFDLALTAIDGADFRVGLQRLKNLRVLCPFWPGAHFYYTGGAVYIEVPGGSVYTATPGGEVYVSGTGEAPRINAGIWLTFEQDWSAWEVHTTDTPSTFTPSISAVRVPILLGIFESNPDPQPLTNELLSCTIHFKQDSPAIYSLQPINASFADGPSVAGLTPQLFPLRANWSKPITAGGATVDIDRQDIGFGGETAEVFYPQSSVRGMQLTFSMVDWTDIARLVGFFHKRCGQVESFWIPGALAECRITAPTSGSSATISVNHAAGLGDNVYLAFTVPGGTPVVRRIVSVDTGADTVTLDAPPGVFQPGQVSVVSLLLARFQKAEIQVQFNTDLVADSQIQFVETSPEYFVVSGETIGSTYGALPTKAFVYRFYRRLPSVTIIDRFTSFETNINASGEIFISHKGHFDHQTIEDSLDIERTSVKLKSRAFSGNPLLFFLPNTLEVPLECEILECYPDASGNAGAPDQIFIGEVTEPNQKGPILSCSITHKLATLLANVPTMLVQPSCPYKLFSGPCGLLESDWRFSGSVISYNSSAHTITIGSFARTNGGSLPTFSAAWFRYGKIWQENGASTWIRSIYDSTVIAGGQITFTLSLPLTVVPSAGDTVFLNPGCTGSVDECRDKFGNFPKNFGGSLFVPNGDPSFGDVPKTSGAGKK